jgi:hypothetical protein
MIKNDPTQSLRLPKVRKSYGHHTWNEDEVAKYEAKHPIGSKARLALAYANGRMYRRITLRRSSGPAMPQTMASQLLSVLPRGSLATTCWQLEATKMQYKFARWYHAG